jgi:hypothetical protein
VVWEDGGREAPSYPIVGEVGAEGRRIYINAAIISSSDIELSGWGCSSVRCSRVADPQRKSLSQASRIRFACGLLSLLDSSFVLCFSSSACAHRSPTALLADSPPTPSNTQPCGREFAPE